MIWVIKCTKAKSRSPVPLCQVCTGGSAGPLTVGECVRLTGKFVHPFNTLVSRMTRPTKPAQATKYHMSTTPPYPPDLFMIILAHHLFPNKSSSGPRVPCGQIVASLYFVTGGAHVILAMFFYPVNLLLSPGWDGSFLWQPCKWQQWWDQGAPV